jgi:hypothetical protein
VSSIGRKSAGTLDVTVRKVPMVVVGVCDVVEVVKAPIVYAVVG